MSIINDALKKAEQEKNKMVTDEPAYTNIASQVYRSKPEQGKKIETAKDADVKQETAGESLPATAKKSPDLIWVPVSILIFVAVISIAIIITNLNKKPVEPLPTPPQSGTGPASTTQATTATESSKTVNLPSIAQTQPEITVPPALRQSGTGPAPEPPAIKIPSPPPALILSGIVAGGKESYAIIDGEIVKKSDVISGAKVVEIYSDRVVLEFDGAEFTLRAP